MKTAEKEEEATFLHCKAGFSSFEAIGGTWQAPLILVSPCQESTHGFPKPRAEATGLNQNKC